MGGSLAVLRSPGRPGVPFISSLGFLELPQGIYFEGDAGKLASEMFSGAHSSSTSPWFSWPSFWVTKGVRPKSGPQLEPAGSCAPDLRVL